MNRYSNYRKINCDWINEIPSDWNLVRGRFLFNSKKQLNTNLQCKNLLSLTLSGVLNKNYHSSDGLRPENYNTYQIFQKDDLVFKMIDLENVNTSRVGIVHEEGIMSPVYIRHEPNQSKIYPKFAYWFYYDLYKKEIYNSIGSGVRSSMTSSDLLDIEIPIPSIKEQKLISQYLDKKIEQIDYLIKKIQMKIELLKEKKTSLINHFITKGLDPNIEMKDSGVEWIGEIPKHWKISRIKYERSKEKYSLVDGPFGSDLKSEHFIDDGDVYVIESGFVTQGKFKQTRDLKTISTDHYKKIRRSECFEGDIIIAKIGEYYGMSSILPDLGRETVISGNCCRLKISSENDAQFFHLILLNLRYQGVIQREVNQTGQPFISLGVIDNLRVFVPPLEEQLKIVEHMRNSTSDIDQVINLILNKIELLKEYRQSLISSTVTGRLRVTEDMI